MTRVECKLCKEEFDARGFRSHMRTCKKTPPVVAESWFSLEPIFSLFSGLFTIGIIVGGLYIAYSVAVPLFYAWNIASKVSGWAYSAWDLFGRETVKVVLEKTSSVVNATQGALFNAQGAIQGMQSGLYGGDGL